MRRGRVKKEKKITKQKKDNTRFWNNTDSSVSASYGGGCTALWRQKGFPV